MDMDINLHAVALMVDECMAELDEIGCYCDEPDLMDIEGVCVPLEEYDAPDYMGAGVPASLTFD